MRLSTSVALALGISFFCRAAPTTGPATAQAANLEQIIARLDSDDWGTRQKAQEDLIKVGESALPELHAAAKSATDPECRSRIKTAIQSIERKSPDAPTRVTLHLHNASPKDALAAVAAQSGIKLDVWPENIWQYGPPKTVTIDLDDGTYWSAMRAICDQADLRLQMMGQRWPQIQRGNATWSRAISQQHGPYLIVAEGISKSQSISLDKPKEIQRLANVNLTVWPELKVRVLRYSPEPVIDSMVDESGASLLPDNWQPRPVNFVAANQQFPYPFSIPLEPARKLGSRIATLKGSVKLSVLTKVGQMLFEDPVKAGKVTKTMGGKHVTLNSCRQNPDGSYSIDVVIVRDGFTDAEWNDMLQNQHQFLLVDSHGVYRPSGNGASYSERRYQTWVTLYLEKNLTSNIRGDDKPRLVWEFSEQTQEVSVPFEFKDLPLPN